MKLLVHLDSDPTATVQSQSEAVQLWLREDASAEWQLTDSRPVDRLTATVLFQMESWPRHNQRLFKVSCGESTWEGTFRAEPKPGSILKLAALSCHKDIGWPWKDAIKELIAHDPDPTSVSSDE